MGVVLLSDELQRLIEQQVVEGRAASAAAFLAEAVMRLVDEAGAEEEAIRQASDAGSADVVAGRYTTVATPADGQALRERLIARLQAGRGLVEGFDDSLELLEWLAERLQPRLPSTQACIAVIDCHSSQVWLERFETVNGWGDGSAKKC